MKKLLIVFLGLFALIVATPYIFSSISNSKIDETILNLNQNSAVVVKETKTDIAYLNTNRSFDIIITDKSFPSNKYFVNNYSHLLKKAVIHVDMSFKHLPITNVSAIGTLKDLDLKGFSKRDYEEVNRVLKDKIVANIVTSNFKNFNIKFNDIVISEDKVEFKLTGMNSDLEITKDFVESNTQIGNLSLNGEGNSIIIADITSHSKIEDNMKKYYSNSNIKKMTFDLIDKKYNGTQDKIALLVDNVTLKGNSSVKDNLLKGESEIEVSKFEYLTNNVTQTSFDNTKYKVTFGRLNYKILEEIVTEFRNKNKKANFEKYFTDFIESGFDMGISLDVKNIKALNRSFGDNVIDVKLSMFKDEIKKAGGIKNIVNSLSMFKFDGIHLNLDLDLSKQINDIIKLKINPAILDMYSKKGYITITKEGGLKTKIETKTGKLFANDKEFKFQ